MPIEFIERKNSPFRMTSSSETLNTKQLSRIGSSSTTNSSSGSGSGSATCTGGTREESSLRSGILSTRASTTSTSRSSGTSSTTTTTSRTPRGGSGQEILPCRIAPHPSSKVMTERWFLCSQTARTEARLLSILDLISSIAYLIIFGLLTYAIIHHPNLVRRYLEEVPENQDIARLLTYGKAKQAFFLSVLLLRPSASFIIAILLFIGAQRRSFSLVRICFIISIIYIVADMILFIPKTIYTQNGKFYVITYIFNVIYMLYEIWVMYELKKEVLEWHEKQGDIDGDGEPETEDTTVVGEGESAGGEEEE